MESTQVVVEVGAADANGGFEARETFRSTTKSKTLHPSWYEVFTLVVADPATDRVRLKVFDYDLGGDPDPLGVCVIAGKLLKDLSGGATRSFWMRLDKPPTGSSKLKYKSDVGPPRVKIEVAYARLTPRGDDFPAVGDGGGGDGGGAPPPPSTAPEAASPRGRTESVLSSCEVEAALGAEVVRSLQRRGRASLKRVPAEPPQHPPAPVPEVVERLVRALRVLREDDPVRRAVHAAARPAHGADGSHLPVPSHRHASFRHPILRLIY